MIQVYIMSVEALTKEENFVGAFLKIDKTRQEKVNQLKREEDKMRSLGAALLLQYAVQEALQNASKIPVESSGIAFSFPEFEEVSEALQSPLPLVYEYGENQKPYLKSYPEFFYSLSHSGDYVLCALGDREVGADIQQYKKNQSVQRDKTVQTDKITVAERWFTIEEKNRINASDGEEREKLFYRYWTAKEAYVKLTGKGLAQGLAGFSVDLEKKAAGEAVLTEYLELPDYGVSVCFYDRGQDVF